MDHPITWGELVTGIIFVWLALYVFYCFVWLIARFAAYRQDMEADDESEEKEPYAGKTLGL